MGEDKRLDRRGRGSLRDKVGGGSVCEEKRERDEGERGDRRREGEREGGRDGERE